METILNIVHFIGVLAILWFGSGMIILQCLWPVNDKPVPKYMWIVCIILLGLFWWWVL